jgi:uncharacterized membrane protein YgcG
MEKNRLSAINYRAWTAAAVSAAFFVPLMVFGGPALANSVAAASQYEYSGSSQYQYDGKVTICHRTHSKHHSWVQIRVSAHGERAHLKHGDQLGTCPVVIAPNRDGGGDHGNKSGDHGKGGDHGNGGDQGNGGDHGNGHGKGK